MALPSLITLVVLPTRRRTSPPFSSLTTNSFLAALTDMTSPLTVFAAFWADEPSDEPDCALAAPASPREVKKGTREKAKMNFFIHVYSLFLSALSFRQKTTISFSALIQGENVNCSAVSSVHELGVLEPRSVIYASVNIARRCDLRRRVIQCDVITEAIIDRLPRSDRYGTEHRPALWSRKII